MFNLQNYSSPYAPTSNLKARNTKITWNVTIICACFMICTFPHNIYGYMTDSHGHTEALFYNVTLGLQWAQYCFNILMHVIQRDQIWSSCLFYLDTKLSIAMNKNKITKRQSRKDSEKTIKTIDCQQLNS